MQLIQLRKVSAKVNNHASTSTSDVPPARSNETSSDTAQQRYGTSAYIDQSEYDVYKPPTANASSQLIRHESTNRATYDNQRSRQTYAQDTNTDDDYPSGQQNYAKNSSTTPYSGPLGRSHSYNGLQSTQGQPRVISAKPRNTVGSASMLYQVKISRSIRWQWNVSDL